MSEFIFTEPKTVNELNAGVEYSIKEPKLVIISTGEVIRNAEFWAIPKDEWDAEGHRIFTVTQIDDSNYKWLVGKNVRLRS